MAEVASPILRNTLELLDRELCCADMGATLMSQRLADILIIQALLIYSATKLSLEQLGCWVH